MVTFSRALQRRSTTSLIQRWSRRRESAERDPFQDLLQEGLARGLFRGAQLYVSEHGSVRFHGVAGNATECAPMTLSSVLPWRCATKPVVAVAVLRALNEIGAGPDAALSDLLPGMPRAMSHLSVRDLLEHRVSFHSDPPPSALLPPVWSDAVEIARSARVARVIPISDEPQYSEWVAWTYLGELTEQITSEPLGDFVRREVLERVGAADSWLGMDPTSFIAYGNRIADLYQPRNTLERIFAVTDGFEYCDRLSPAFGARGPASELGQLYESLCGLSPSNTRVLPKSLEQAIWASDARKIGESSPHDERERYQSSTARWCLGFQRTPSRFGPRCSPASFGHLGESGGAYADHESGRVISFLFNGAPGWTAAQHLFAATVAATNSALDPRVAAP